jgi:hypothetical protein
MLFLIFHSSTGYVEDFKKYALGLLQFLESHEHSSRDYTVDYQSFLSIPLNWVPPSPHPQASVSPPHLSPTTVYVLSSELGLSHPLSRQRVCPSPRNQRGRAHSLAGEGLGEPQFRRLQKRLSTLPTLRLTSNPTYPNIMPAHAQGKVVPI